MDSCLLDTSILVQLESTTSSGHTAAAAIGTFCARFPVLSEPPEVVGIWMRIVTTRELKGKRIHDAHLLATLIANGISHLLTFNAPDFPPTETVTVLAPRP